MPLWTHQQYGFEEFCRKVSAERRRICITSPTGMGKTELAKNIIEWALDQSGRVVFYTHRRMLLDQSKKKIGIVHGTRAAGHFPDFSEKFQIASVQTEHRRSVIRQIWDVHEADLAIFDECHLQKARTHKEIVDRHIMDGATILGLTATPIELSHIYEDLIVAGNNSAGRECGALVSAVHYGVDEPDLSRIKSVQFGQDLSENEQRAAMGAVVDGKPTIRLQKLVGRIFDWYRILNPGQLPCVLFAPGVKESLWFAEQFTAQGIPAAHIDGNQIWYDGEFRTSDTDARDFIATAHQTGTIKVVCTRFVLREGIDWWWISHMIFACVFGELQSYIQSGGRGLRKGEEWFGKENVIIQDHGGNWWRHGSLNSDREWDLSMTSHAATSIYRDSFDEPTTPKPYTCPGCQRILLWKDMGDKVSAKCPSCGYEMDFTKRSRPVLMDDGTLVNYRGDGYEPRPTRKHENTETLWTKIYWQFRNSKVMTFSQAIGYFEKQYGYRPPKTLKFMPVRLVDFWRRVGSIPVRQLRQESM